MWAALASPPSDFESFLCSCDPPIPTNVQRPRKRAMFPSSRSVTSTAPPARPASRPMSRESSYLSHLPGLRALYASLGEGFFRYLWTNAIILFPVRPDCFLRFGSREKLCCNQPQSISTEPNTPAKKKRRTELKDNWLRAPALSYEEAAAKRLYVEYVRKASFQEAFKILRGSDLISSSSSFHAGGKWPRGSFLGALLWPQSEASGARPSHKAVRRGAKCSRVVDRPLHSRKDPGVLLRDYLMLGDMFIGARSPVELTRCCVSNLLDERNQGGSVANALQRAQRVMLRQCSLLLDSVRDIRAVSFINYCVPIVRNTVEAPLACRMSRSCKERFIRLTLQTLLPPKLLGSRQNRSRLIRNLLQALPQRSTESLILSQLMRKMRLRDLRGCYLPGDFEYGLALKTRNMLSKVFGQRLIIFIARHIVVPALRTFLYVSVSGADTRELVFYRRLQWARFRLHYRAPGLSFRPKSTSFRPIVKLGQRIPGHLASSEFCRVLAVGGLHIQSTRDLFVLVRRVLSTAIQFELERDEAIVSHVEQVRSKMARYLSERKGNPCEMHTLITDLENCFSKISLDACLADLRLVIPEEGVKLDHFEVSSLPAQGSLTKEWLASPRDSHLSKLHRKYKKQSPILIVAYVNGTPPLTFRRGAILDIIERGCRFFAPAGGLPQGLPISSLLCNFFHRRGDLALQSCFRESLLLRWVDDIFYLGPQPLEVSQLEAAFGATMNAQKTQVLTVSPSHTERRVAALKYIGYSLTPKWIGATLFLQVKCRLWSDEIKRERRRPRRLMSLPPPTLMFKRYSLISWRQAVLASATRAVAFALPRLVTDGAINPPAEIEKRRQECIDFAVKYIGCQIKAYINSSMMTDVSRPYLRSVLRRLVTQVAGADDPPQLLRRATSQLEKAAGRLR